MKIYNKLKDHIHKITHWETWHYLAKYIPIMPVWAWHCFKAQSLWFFSSSNPTLTFGGFEGESKSEMYAQLPPGSFPKSQLITSGISLTELAKVVQATGFNYPFAVKPDVGMMGLMFRKIHNWEQLSAYHHIMPADYFVQEFLSYPLEVSVFYYRFPNAESGTITGFIKKEFLEVIGNGQSTLLELMETHPRAKFRLDEMKSKHASHLHLIIEAGASYILSQALNLSRGGRLVSLAKEKDEDLLAVFDRLSLYTGKFYYGRYDIKCRSIEDLKRGKHFSILEFNGCGAEPHHIYGNANTLLQAYAIVIKHWKVLAEISQYNFDHGIERWDLRKGWKFLGASRQHFKVLKKLDNEFPMT